MSDQPPLVRQWTLLRLLCARRHGATLREMAEETGVGQKTIRRDLTAFSSAGFPLVSETGEYGRKTWRVADAWGQPPLTFRFDEALALYLGRRFLQPLAGTFFWEAAQSAFRKIRTCLTEEALKYLEATDGRLHLTSTGISDYSEKQSLIDDLLVAVEDEVQSVIVYQSQTATEAVEYEVDPYGFVYHHGSMYLVAFSRRHQELRHFKVDRIDAVELSHVPISQARQLQSAGAPVGFVRCLPRDRSRRGGCSIRCDRCSLRSRETLSRKSAAHASA